MPWAAHLTLMNQTWQHVLPVDQEPGRFRRGEIVEVQVATEPFPDDISTIKSERELNAFYWAQITGIPDNITLEQYDDWLMPDHVAITHGKIRYSFLSSAPQIGETLTASRTGVTGEVDQIDNSFVDALSFDGDEKQFKRGEWIFQDNDNTRRARIRGYEQDPSGLKWFVIEEVEGAGFTPGQLFTGLTSGAKAMTITQTVLHGGRMRLINVTGEGDGSPEEITLTPSGTTGWLMDGAFSDLARNKRLLPFSHSNTPQQIRDDFQSKSWTQLTHDQLRQLIRRQPDDVVPNNDANTMDAETLDDDAGGSRRRRGGRN